MNLNLDFEVILFFALGMVLLYAIGWLFLVPFKKILKYLANAFLGGLLIFVMNLLSPFIGFRMPLNPLTALIIGFFGIPGFILVLLIKLFI